MQEEGKRMPYTSIALRRTPCFGTCPAYEVTFREDGSATYVGASNVAKIGSYVGRLRKADYARLCYALEHLNFTSLDREYRASSTGASTCFVTVTTETGEVAISDYGSRGPINLWIVQQVIDSAVAGISWTRATVSTQPKFALIPVVAGIAGERHLAQMIELGNGVKENANIDVTTKGNGTLTIANLSLRVVDEHDDGAVYQNGMANIEFADVDGDGWRDLVVSGIVQYTDEKTSAVRKHEPFVFVFKFDPTKKSFRQTYKHATFALEDSPASGN